MKNLKDYILDAWFEIESFFFVLLDYHKLPINRAFCDFTSHILSHKVTHRFWNIVYPDEKGKWRMQKP